MHGGKRAFFLVGLLCIVAIAGCTGPAPKAQVVPTTPPPSVPIDENVPTGGLEGVVINDEEQPVADARVYLVGFNVTTMTGGQGTFRFGTVNEGDYFLAVEHAAYFPQSLGVRVAAGETVTLEVKLAPRPVPVPGVEAQLLELSISCRGSVSHPAGTTPLNPDGKGTCGGSALGDYRNNRSATLPLKLGVVGVLVEVSWEPETKLTNQLDFTLIPTGTRGDEAWIVAGKPVLSMYVSKAMFDAHRDVDPKKNPNYYAQGGNLTAEVDIMPGAFETPVDVGLATGQDVDVWITSFYVVEPADLAPYLHF